MKKFIFIILVMVLLPSICLAGNKGMFKKGYMNEVVELEKPLSLCFDADYYITTNTDCALSFITSSNIDFSGANITGLDITKIPEFSKLQKEVASLRNIIGWIGALLLYLGVVFILKRIKKYRKEDRKWEKK